MFVYNISIKIIPEIEKEWVQWQQQEHIPDVMASGRFTEYKFYKLLEEDDGGITYVIQYFTTSLEQYEMYTRDTAPLLRKKVIDRWGDKFIAFRTIMEVVN